MNAAVRALPIVGTLLIVIGAVVALVASRAVETERLVADLTRNYVAPASQVWVSVGVIVAILGVGTVIAFLYVRAQNGKKA